MTNTKENDSAVVDRTAISYLSRLLKTSEEAVENLTDNESDCLLIIKQASKKRLNKRILKKLHPKVSSLLMTSREGDIAGLTDKEIIFLSNALHKYFFELRNEDMKNCLNKKKIETIDEQVKSYTICLIVTTLHEEGLEKYWKSYMDEADLPKAKKFYEEYAKDGLKDCEIDINFNNCKEVLKIIRDKYL